MAANSVLSSTITCFRKRFKQKKQPIRVLSSYLLRVLSSYPLRVLSSYPLRVLSSYPLRVLSSYPLRVLSSYPLRVLSSYPLRVLSSYSFCQSAPFRIRIRVLSLTVKMSVRTLKSHLNGYSLNHRNVIYGENVVRHRIDELLNAPRCMGGYRSIWHKLQLEGVQVPRDVVERGVRELQWRIQGKSKQIIAAQF